MIILGYFIILYCSSNTYCSKFTAIVTFPNLDFATMGVIFTLILRNILWIRTFENISFTLQWIWIYCVTYFTVTVALKADWTCPQIKHMWIQSVGWFHFTTLNVVKVSLISVVWSIHVLLLILTNSIYSSWTIYVELEYFKSHTVC